MSETYCPVSIRKDGERVSPVIIKDVVTTKKDPEEKMYILLYYLTDRGEEIASFVVFIGRTAMYEYIQEIVENLDLYESKVLLEGVDITKSISVYEFMKVMEQHFNDSFDIESYVIGDAPDVTEFSIYDLVGRY